MSGKKIKRITVVENDGVEPYTYEEIKIELFGGSSQKGTSLSNAPNNSISATKIVEDVEKPHKNY